MVGAEFREVAEVAEVAHFSGVSLDLHFLWDFPKTAPLAPLSPLLNIEPNSNPTTFSACSFVRIHTLIGDVTVELS